MNISPINNFVTSPVLKKHGGRILGGVAAVALGVAGGVTLAKSCVKTAPTENTYNAKHGDMYWFLPQNADSCGRAQVNMSKEPSVQVIRRNFRTAKWHDDRVTELKFSQQIGDNLVTGNLVADGMYEKQVKCGKKTETVLAGIPTKNWGEKFDGTITVTNKNSNNMNVYNISLEKSDNGDWNISIGENDNQKNLIMRIEHNCETGNASINVYDGRACVYQHDTGKKMLSDDEYMGDKAFKSMVAKDVAKVFPMLLLATLAVPAGVIIDDKNEMKSYDEERKIYR
ncbi:hypothetical protein IJ732_07135 [bacterium]|nr:hypothetical protein [bacterium]